MQASTNVLLRSLPLTLAAILFIAPAAFAKKDLFGNDPAAKQAAQAQQLVPTAPAPSQITPEAPALDTAEAVADDTTAESGAPLPEHLPKRKKEPSYLEKQLTRLKLNIAETKNDLFGPKDAKRKARPAAAPAQETNLESSQSESAEAEPVISPTEAAQRAQLIANGQVMNVRKYKDEGQTRYAVKLLQKNGRMKTITLDANTGEPIEDPVQ